MIQPITLSIEIAVAALALSFLIAVLVGQSIAAGHGRSVFKDFQIVQLAGARAQAMPGEIYAGSSVDPITERITHLYVLPGVAETTWADSADWATERAGSLPSIDELPRVIEAIGATKGRYWSRERSRDDPQWAFVFDAAEKTLDDDRVDAELLAVVVRHTVA